MAGKYYVSCQGCGIYYHRDEIIHIPEEAPKPEQKRLCLNCAQHVLTGLIRLEECNRRRDRRWRAA